MTKRIEAQSQHHEALLQKLNNIAQELQESRVIANKERDRALHLERLLQENLANHQVKTNRDDVTTHVAVVTSNVILTTLIGL